MVNDFPVIKGKRMTPRLAQVEMLWFLQGKTDVQWLRDHGVNYWNEWEGADGTIGKTYGYQYRNFCGVDNVKETVEQMISHPTGRRHILDIWNPKDLPEMNLPPCVIYYQFNCFPIAGQPGHFDIDTCVMARSQDMFLGVPYDFMLVAYITQIFALYANSAKTNTKGYVFHPRDINYTGSNCHVYKNHLKAVGEYFANVIENRNDVINSKAQMVVNYDLLEEMGIAAGFEDGFDSIDDILKLIVDSDFKIITVEHAEGMKEYLYPAIKASVAV